MPGYTSTHKYAVSKSEVEEQTVITLQLVELATPYTHVWEENDAEMERYQGYAAQGLSLGAYDEEKLVGLALTERRDWNRTLWIWEIGVEEAYRRQGIGRQLMDRLIDIAQSEGLRAISFETQNTNVPAIRFYRSMGCEIEAIDLSYYTNDDVMDGEVAIFMKRKTRVGD
ncbi:MAG: GNAT family N-acetyltransferase [Anaerolineae bacterium]|nr:GNAT family N-acetyltransferase [Anaerolineae bacterium]